MSLTARKREQLRLMFNGKCAYCGSDLGRGWCADHVEPIYRNWTRTVLNTMTGSVMLFPSDRPRFPERDNEANLFPCCRPCNIHKATYSIEQWRSELAKLTGFLRRGYPTYRHALRFGQVIETCTPIVFWFEKFREETASNEQNTTKA